MRIMVFLAFMFQAWVGGTVGRRGVRGKREEFLEERCNVGCGLRGGLVAIGACFDLGQDCLGLVTRTILCPWCDILFSRSIAHCSNCSSVISAVGGVSYRFSRNG